MDLDCVEEQNSDVEEEGPQGHSDAEAAKLDEIEEEVKTAAAEAPFIKPAYAQIIK